MKSRALQEGIHPDPDPLSGTRTAAAYLLPVCACVCYVCVWSTERAADLIWGRRG